MGTVLWIWNKGQAAVVGLAWLPVVCVCVSVKLATHYIISHGTKHSYNEFSEHSSRGNQLYRYEPAEQFLSLESFVSAWLDKENIAWIFLVLWANYVILCTPGLNQLVSRRLSSKRPVSHQGSGACVWFFMLTATNVIRSIHFSETVLEKSILEEKE